MKKALFTALLTAALASGAAHAGDAGKGEKVFKKCKACHVIGSEKGGKTGPDLTGVIGRAAGAVDGFGYSKGMMEMAEGGLVWTEENLDHFLAKPKDFVSGTKMSFAGLRKDDDRADLIAYLASVE